MGYLVREPILVAELVTQVQSADRGGLACFMGSVRNHHGGREVLRLDYEAYEPMVEAECASIIAEAESHWETSVALRHRIGRLEIGDVAVAVVAAATHREEAFAACRYVIEELKRRVPIWKREYYADGTVGWVGGEAGQADSGAAGPRGSEPEVVAGLGGHTS